MKTLVFLMGLFFSGAFAFAERESAFLVDALQVHEALSWGGPAGESGEGFASLLVPLGPRDLERVYPVLTSISFFFQTFYSLNGLWDSPSLAIRDSIRREIQAFSGEGLEPPAVVNWNYHKVKAEKIREAGATPDYSVAADLMILEARAALQILSRSEVTPSTSRFSAAHRVSIFSTPVSYVGFELHLAKDSAVPLLTVDARKLTRIHRSRRSELLLDLDAQTRSKLITALRPFAGEAVSPTEIRAHLLGRDFRTMLVVRLDPLFSRTLLAKAQPTRLRACWQFLRGTQAL